ncbi:MAG TPA: response regulator [Candidatus Baltobacteraceae bacterium]|jgi:putative two-component system response regulator|nr:response regulator [Candidatus Baltobacteraceae bacterium]
MDVLVIDDNTVNSRVYERIIARLPGFACKCFDNPSDALAWSGQNAPALVVADYAMPQMNGIDFVKAFRQIPGRSETPIIMLTAMNSARLRDEAHGVGVDVFFAKPINPERFLSEARRLLEQSTQNRARN